MDALNIQLQGYVGPNVSTKKYKISEGAEGVTRLIDAIKTDCATRAADNAGSAEKSLPYHLAVMVIHTAMDLSGEQLESLSASTGVSNGVSASKWSGDTTINILASRLGPNAEATNESVGHSAAESKTGPPMTPGDLDDPSIPSSEDTTNGQQLTTDLEKKQAESIKALEAQVKALTQQNASTKATITEKEKERQIARQIVEEISIDLKPASAASLAFHKMCNNGPTETPVTYIRAAETVLFASIRNHMDPHDFQNMATPAVTRTQDGAHMLFKIVTRAKNASSYSKQAALKIMSEEVLQEGDTISAVLSRIERCGHMLELSGIPRPVVYELQKNRIMSIMADSFYDSMGILRFTNFATIKRSATKLSTWSEYKDFLERETQSPGWNQMLTELYKATAPPAAMAAALHPKGGAGGNGAYRDRGGNWSDRGRGGQGHRCAICNSRNHTDKECDAATKPCWNVLRRGKCSKKNCPFAHDGPIMVAAKARDDKRIRQHAPGGQTGASIRAAVADALSIMGFVPPGYSGQNGLDVNQHHSTVHHQQGLPDSPPTDDTDSGRG